MEVFLLIALTLGCARALRDEQSGIRTFGTHGKWNSVGRSEDLCTHEAVVTAYTTARGHHSFGHCNGSTLHVPRFVGTGHHVRNG